VGSVVAGLVDFAATMVHGMGLGLWGFGGVEAHVACAREFGICYDWIGDGIRVEVSGV
jgi:hypothetical protein